MAKSRTSRQAGRDHSSIARRSLPRLTPYRLVSPAPLTLYQDLRTYHPEGPFRPLFSSPRPAARIVGKALKSSRTRWGEGPHPGLTFAAPNKVLLCVRRKRRKEVMFAKNKAGKRGQRKPRRNYWSSISC